MRWAKAEYILKGVFLGLLLFIALMNLDWEATGRVALFVTAGLGLALFLGMVRQIKAIKGLARNPVGYFLFLLLRHKIHFLIFPLKTLVKTVCVFHG